MILHYGQQVFEGLKAFAGPNEEDIFLFRPDMNIGRFNKSCERLCIPMVNPELFMEQMCRLIRMDRDWIPRPPGTSVYVRPTIIASEPHLGVRPSQQYLFYIILSPVGADYPEGFAPVKIMVTDKYIRACRGGVGEAKTAETMPPHSWPRKKLMPPDSPRFCGSTLWTESPLRKSAQ